MRDMRAGPGHDEATRDGEVSVTEGVRRQEVAARARDHVVIRAVSQRSGTVARTAGQVDVALRGIVDVRVHDRTVDVARVDGTRICEYDGRREGGGHQRGDGEPPESARQPSPGSRNGSHATGFPTQRRLVASIR